MQYTSAIDWYQYTVRLDIDFYPYQNENWTFELAEYSTKHMEKLFHIYYDGIHFANIECKPKSSILKPYHGFVRIINNWLYHEKTKDLIRELNQRNLLYFNNFTRVDIAVDFNKFHQNKCPQKFINDLMQGTIIKKGKAKFATYGKISDNGNIFQTLKFGSETSKISYKIYNKTQELKEAKNKPYIIDFWEQNGLDITKDIYRLEFSFKSQQREFSQVTQDGELKESVHFNDIDFFDRQQRENVFQWACDEYWQFAKHKKVIHKSRLPSIVYVKLNAKKLLHFNIVLKSETNRSTKIFLKKLKEHADEIRSKHTNNEHQHYHSSVIYNILYKKIVDSRLSEWAEYRGLMPSEKELIEPPQNE